MTTSKQWWGKPPDTKLSCISNVYTLVVHLHKCNATDVSCSLVTPV